MNNPIVVKRWVSPFYMKVLHGNYVHMPEDEERERFNAKVRKRLTTITPKIASSLVAGTWRLSITGSWFAGLAGLVECRDQIGARLVASQTCYAGQAHAFAMAWFADEASVAFLVDYLNIYLRESGKDYDQDWAMPALMWIDKKLGSHHAEPFVAPGGLWETYLANKAYTTRNLEWCQSAFWRRMEHCEEHFLR